MNFQNLNRSIKYYHSHVIDPKALQAIEESPNVIFEIDFAYAHSNFKPTIKQRNCYIGHPEEFYTLLKKPFPEVNVSIGDIAKFLETNRESYLLIDIKDVQALDEVEKLIANIGSERCLCHSFISNWTTINTPEGITSEPHWFREDIDLFVLDNMLSRINVPLIANCRGFSNENIEHNGLIQKMIQDANKCKSVFSLGLYYPGAPIPDLDYLQEIRNAGYLPWVNANIENVDILLANLAFIGMCDKLEECTKI